MQKVLSRLKGPAWTKVLRECADPQRAKHHLGLLAETPALDELARASKDQAEVLAAIFSGSHALTNLLVACPDWLEVVRPKAVEHGRRKQGLRQERDQWLQKLLGAGDFAGALAQVRELKAREMLRIGARDLAHRGTLMEIVGEISDLADVCLETVWQVCTEQLVARYGEPYHRDGSGRWQRTGSCVLGMGKLGGRELNYSSDVDVLFVYSEEGEVYAEPPSPELRRADGPSRTNQRDASASGNRKLAARPSQKSTAPPTLTNHQFFNRLAEALIAEVTRLGPQGALYRIDLRLRPEGDAGPLTRSVDSYETYYAQWGQTWERMMLIKARLVAGDERLAGEFLEMIQPFRYPRLINESVLAEVGAMKDRIENEVVRPDELERNVKLGRGGIREIEFTTQALQLLHGGRQPFLQGSQTLPSLEKLAQYELIPVPAVRELSEAYCFLRDIEHRLQMDNNQQTHTIPTDRDAQQRLARLMEYAEHKQFEAARRGHTDRVRKIFESVLKAEVPQAHQGSPVPRRFEGMESTWKQLLTQHGFKDVERAFRVLREFVEGPGYVHVSSRTSELAYQLLAKIFELSPAGIAKSEVRNPKSERSPKSEIREL
ncbi:MAG TPA: hypothetical protein VL793_10770, partial [Patescibacteria group bacterium]|nr:hypothetical protein [Patescibacteria group bacterium]